MFQFGNLDQEFGPEYWTEKLRSAYVYRREIVSLEENTGYRLIHAEGDGMPGVVLDIYSKAASLQLRTKGALKLAPVIEEFIFRGIIHGYLVKQLGSSWVAPTITHSPDPMAPTTSSSTVTCALDTRCTNARIDTSIIAPNRAPTGIGGLTPYP